MRLLISLVSAWCLWSPTMLKADFVSDVKQAWKQRQDQIGTLTFEWEGTQFMARHSQAAGNDPRNPVPKTDQTFKTNRRLAIEIKGRVRFETSSKTWSQRHNKLVPQQSIKIFDGSVKKTYFPKSNIDYPTLYIKEGNSNSVAYDIRCVPIGLMYRPFDKQIGPGLNERSMTLSDRTGVVDKRKCRILEFESDEVWVDEESPFLPRKYVMLSDGHPRFVITIHYDQKGQEEKLFGWVPSSWGFTEFSPVRDRRILSSRVDVVTRFSVNSDIADAEFDVEILPGTQVNDYIAGERYSLKGNGKKQKLTR